MTIRYYSAAEIRDIYRRPIGTVYRLASEHEWHRSNDRRRPILYNGDDVEASMRISDEAFLTAVDEATRLRTEENGAPWTIGVSRWDIAAVLADHPEHVAGPPVDYPEMAEKVVLAKARQLVRRGLLDGCYCGCRGDFVRTAT